MADRPKAIDCWLNPTTGVSDYRPEFLVRVARDYFKREKEMFAHTPLEELLAQMDAAGVERAIITMDGHQPEPIHEIARSFPGKFICSAVIARRPVWTPSAWSTAWSRSTHAPKYLPAELIQFMNTRGQHKVLFASDHPVLPFERCLAEAAALPFREGVLEKHLREKALAVFRWDSA